MVWLGQLHSGAGAAQTAPPQAPQELAVERPQSTTPSPVCEQCGVSLPPRPKSQWVGIVHHYCSRACRALGQRVPLADRFWSKVRIGLPDECWEWQACRKRYGYGELKAGERNDKAHRVAYRLTYGPIPDGLWVLHRCDNPPCCNSRHLFLGDSAANVEDRHRKGRDGWAAGDANGSRKFPERRPRGDGHWSRLRPERLNRGEAHPSAKLTVVQVQTIRARYAAGGVTRRALAREYGVSFQALSALVQRQTWKDVP